MTRGRERIHLLGLGLGFVRIFYSFNKYMAQVDTQKDKIAGNMTCIFCVCFSNSCFMSTQISNLIFASYTS